MVDTDKESRPSNLLKIKNSQTKRSSNQAFSEYDAVQTGRDFSLCVCMLASGSKGNAIFLSDGVSSILIDAGLSGIEIERRLQSKDLRPEDLDAILVSHEHIDHIQGVGVLSRRFNLPVYISSKTGAAASTQLKNVYRFKEFECGATFNIKSLIIHPFTVSHDAEDPAGFTVYQNGCKVGIATDLGLATSVVKEHLKGCTMLVLESNHDATMLTNGPYPWSLKQRIRSRTGHLSNVASKQLLREVQHERLKHVVLAHLSETNNTPQKAFTEVAQAIVHRSTKLHVARQDRCGALIYLK